MTFVVITIEQDEYELCRKFSAVGWDLVFNSPLEVESNEARVVLEEGCCLHTLGNLGYVFPGLQEVRVYVRYARRDRPAHMHVQVGCPRRIRVDPDCVLWNCESE